MVRFAADEGVAAEVTAEDAPDDASAVLVRA